MSFMSYKLSFDDKSTLKVDQIEFSKARKKSERKKIYNMLYIYIYR